MLHLLRLIQAFGLLTQALRRRKLTTQERMATNREVRRTEPVLRVFKIFLNPFTRDSETTA